MHYIAELNRLQGQLRDIVSSETSDSDDGEDVYGEGHSVHEQAGQVAGRAKRIAAERRPPAKKATSVQLELLRSTVARSRPGA